MARQTTKVADRSTRVFDVLVGIDWGEGYHPVGSVVTGLPANIVATWLDEGVIREAAPDAKPHKADAFRPEDGA